MSQKNGKMELLKLGWEERKGDRETNFIHLLPATMLFKNSASWLNNFSLWQIKGSNSRLQQDSPKIQILHLILLNVTKNFKVVFKKKKKN